MSDLQTHLRFQEQCHKLNLEMLLDSAVSSQEIHDSLHDE